MPWMMPREVVLMPTKKNNTTPLFVEDKYPSMPSTMPLDAILMPKSKKAGKKPRDVVK